MDKDTKCFRHPVFAYAINFIKKSEVNVKQGTHFIRNTIHIRSNV